MNHDYKKGVCTVVIDDANGLVYLYGNSIYHENYHVPENACDLTFATTLAPTEKATEIVSADEYFIGDATERTVELQHKPVSSSPVFVFLNGLKQRVGEGYDYTIADNIITFNNSVSGDTIEVVYSYEEE